MTPSRSRRLTDKWLSGRVKTLLAQFYEPREDEMQAAIVADWLVTLGDFPADEVNAACHLYLIEPRRTASGAPARPIPADIRDRILAQRLSRLRPPAPSVLPELASPGRVRCTPEAAARMLEEAGLGEVIQFRRVPRSGEEG